MANNKTFLNNPVKSDVKKVFRKTTILIIILFGQAAFIRVKLNTQEKLIQKQQKEIEWLRKTSNAEKGFTRLREISLFIIQWYFTHDIKENLAETTDNVHEIQKVINGTKKEFHRKFTQQNQLNEEYDRGINKNTELLWDQAELMQDHHREIANLEKIKAELKNQVQNQDKKLLNTKKRTKLVEAFTHSLSESHKNMSDEMNQLKDDLTNKRADMLNSKRDLQKLYKRFEKIKSTNSTMKKKREKLEKKILMYNQKEAVKKRTDKKERKIQKINKLEIKKPKPKQKLEEGQFKKPFSNLLSKVNLSLALSQKPQSIEKIDKTDKTHKKKEKSYICEVSPYLPPVFIHEKGKHF